MDQYHNQLFVYGTLRRDYHHPAHDYISRYFEWMGMATVQGKLYDCGEYPAAVPSAENVFITGELYRLKQAADFDQAMALLDEYEEVESPGNEWPLFRREQVAVRYNALETMAWIYWFNRDVGDSSLIVSGDALEKEPNNKKQEPNKFET